MITGTLSEDMKSIVVATACETVCAVIVTLGLDDSRCDSFLETLDEHVSREIFFQIRDIVRPIVNRNADQWEYAENAMRNRLFDTQNKQD